MKVKNISKRTLNVIGIGVVEPDGIVEVPDNFNNTNFEQVKKPVENGTKADQSAPNNNK